MGYEITFRVAGDTETIGGLYLGSGQDLMLLHEWVESLPSKAYPKLVEFFAEGVTDDADHVAGEVVDAFDETEPTDPALIAIVDQLIEVLDRWPDRTQAMISDGANDPDWPEPTPPQPS